MLTVKTMISVLQAAGFDLEKGYLASLNPTRKLNEAVDLSTTSPLKAARGQTVQIIGAEYVPLLSGQVAALQLGFYANQLQVLRRPDGLRADIEITLGTQNNGKLPLIIVTTMLETRHKSATGLSNKPRRMEFFTDEKLAAVYAIAEHAALAELLAQLDAELLAEADA